MKKEQTKDIGILRRAEISVSECGKYCACSFARPMLGGDAGYVCGNPGFKSSAMTFTESDGSIYPEGIYLIERCKMCVMAEERHIMAYGHSDYADELYDAIPAD
jgi:hypothetical protein